MLVVHLCIALSLKWGVVPPIRLCQTLWSEAAAFGSDSGDRKVAETRRSYEMMLTSDRMSLWSHAESLKEGKLSEDTVAYQVEYEPVHLERALKILEGKKASDFRVAVPVSAGFTRVGSQGERPLRMWVTWLEDGFESTGIYLADKDGNIIQELRWTYWRLGTKLVFRPTLRRVFESRFVIGRPPGEQPERLASSELVPHIPREVLSKIDKVGIIMRDGRRSEPVDAFVLKEFRKLTEPEE